MTTPAAATRRHYQQELIQTRGYGMLRNPDKRALSEWVEEARAYLLERDMPPYLIDSRALLTEMVLRHGYAAVKWRAGQADGYRCSRFDEVIGHMWRDVEECMEWSVAIVVGYAFDEPGVLLWRSAWYNWRTAVVLLEDPAWREATEACLRDDRYLRQNVWRAMRRHGFHGPAAWEAEREAEEADRHTRSAYAWERADAAMPLLERRHIQQEHPDWFTPDGSIRRGHTPEVKRAIRRSMHGKINDYWWAKTHGAAITYFEDNYERDRDLDCATVVEQYVASVSAPQESQESSAAS